MFAFDDMTTDSTSVLKDFRHPSLSSINVGSTQPGPNLGRVISLNRSVSSATAASGSQIRRRNSNSKVGSYLSPIQSNHILNAYQFLFFLLFKVEKFITSPLWYKLQKVIQESLHNGANLVLIVLFVG